MTAVEQFMFVPADWHGGPSIGSTPLSAPPAACKGYISSRRMSNASHDELNYYADTLNSMRVLRDQVTESPFLFAKTHRTSSPIAVSLRRDRTSNW